jgi:hypothetical protein
MRKVFPRILFLTSIVACFFGSQIAFAAMRAPFPDSKSLQPIPVDVKPNISHNVNATYANYSQGSSTYDNVANNPSEASPTVNVVTTNSVSNSIWVIILSSLAVVLVFFGLKKFFLY